MSVRHLHTIRATHVADVGGKAASLGELLAAGYPVPRAFVITAGANALSPALSAEIIQAFDAYNMQRAAVRSSGIGEDGQEYSWAGQFATALHVPRDQLLQAVAGCWQSATSARVEAYAQGAAFNLAVLVQAMVNSDVAGVAFSANPITGSTNEVIVEAVYGLGELLVQGIVTPDNFLLDKHTGAIIDQDIAAKPVMLTYQNGHTTEVPVRTELQDVPALNPAQLKQLAALARDIEDYYGYPVDIEWAFEAGELYLLQARPITTV